MLKPHIMSLTQGMYMGVFAGFGLVLWVFIGSVLYPPNSYPGVRSVRECSFYQDALAANSTFANGTYDNSSAKIFRKYGDGFIRNSFKPYTRYSKTKTNLVELTFSKNSWTFTGDWG